MVRPRDQSLRILTLLTQPAKTGKKYFEANTVGKIGQNSCSRFQQRLIPSHSADSTEQIREYHHNQYETARSSWSINVSMTSKNNSPDDIDPSGSTEARMAEVLEEGFHSGAVIGTVGMMITGSFFIVYAVVGGILTAINSPIAPPNYLSMTGDPWFFVTGVVVSTFTFLSTGSRILYRMLTGVDSSRSQFVLILNYIGLGCAGAALRFLVPPTLDFILTWL